MGRVRVKLLDDSQDDSRSATATTTPGTHRKNKAYTLTAADWLEIQQRILAGEKVKSIAADFGIAPQTINDRVVNGRQNQVRADTTRKLATTIAKSEKAFAALPVVEQVMVRTLADHLKNISNHLAHAATNGARNAHTLSAIASDCIDRMEPDNEELMNGILLTAAVHATAGANEAAKIGMDLLRINKESLGDPGGNVYDLTPHLIKDSDPVAASATYQRLVGSRKQ